MAAYALPGIFVMGCLVYVMESYVIRCPEQAEWNIRAEIQCQNITKYFCLYNYIRYTYEEGCTGPEWEIPGSKRVYSINFNSAPCNDIRYQPIKFVTNGSSGCIFRKSLCTEEGQTLFTNGTTRTDSTCRCDYKQGYAFVTVPRNKCFCCPSEEDCSCYLKKCQAIGYYLSADYECTKNGSQKTVCSLMSENPSEDPHIDMAPTGTPREYDSYAIKRTYDVAILVSICLFVMIVITMYNMYIMLRQRLPRCTCLSTEQTGNAESKRMDTGPLLDTIKQNGSKHESAHIELGREHAGPSLYTIDQNATSNQPAHIELGREHAGPSLYTIDQNATSNQPDRNRPEGNNEDNEIALRESDVNQQSALEQLKANIRKEGLVRVFRRFNEVLDKLKNEPVKLAVTGTLGNPSSWKSALDELKDNIAKEGLDAALEHFNEDLDNWKNEPVKLAVTGKSGVGKSSFINAIRNLKPGDPYFATSSSSGNTTKHAMVYEYPGNPKITLHDLPGFGTMKLPKNDYEKTMELHQYDYILIFVGNIDEHDIEIAKRLKEMKKPFCFVRSKLDIDIQNAQNDGESVIDAVEKISSKSLSNLEDAGFKKVKFFIISNRNRRSFALNQFSDLVSHVQSNLPGMKCDAVMFSILGELSCDEIESKYKILKDRLWKVSVASVALATTPVSNMDIVFNMGLICKELLLYHKVFGFEQQVVKDILKDDYIRQMLNASSIIEIQPVNEAMHAFAKTELEKLRTSEARKSPNDLIVPFIESLVSEWPAGGDTFRLLIQVLNGCRDDAKLVYCHLMRVDV